MVEPKTRREARAQAEAKYAFLLHATVFALVMTLLIVINVLATPDAMWFVWPLLGWGLALALHAARVFLLDRHAILDRLTERELRRSGRRGSNEG